MFTTYQTLGEFVEIVHFGLWITENKKPRDNQEFLQGKKQSS